jgi:hypothetical protein
MPADTDQAGYERGGYTARCAALTAAPGDEPVLRTGETEVRSEEELEIFFPERTVDDSHTQKLCRRGLPGLAG